jgi:cytochrome c biogenesis DsbD-like protein
MRSILLLTILLTACPAKKEETPQPTPEPGVAAPKEPDWKSAFKHVVNYDAAKKAIVVDVTIEPGFHAYTTGETIGKPMAVALDENGAFAHAGEVEYPAGVTKDLPIGKSVIVEGTAQIVAPIQKKEGGTGDSATGTFKYQVCTEEACDRPRTQPFTVAVGG